MYVRFRLHSNKNKIGQYFIFNLDFLIINLRPKWDLLLLPLHEKVKISNIDRVHNSYKVCMQALFI